ncbi:MAG: hypothetical protein ACTSQK_10740 [Candidatus Heimdallarchaeota archaeon]
MAIDSFSILTLYKAIELLLLFWLLGLLFKWVLAFVLGEKGAKMIGFIGYAVNFALKKFILTKIFRIEVEESDPFKLSFKFEETKRWDILFTSLVLVPMSIGLILGVLVGTIGLVLEEDLIILSIFLYIFGFLIAVNSVPTFQDVKALKDSSARSILIWFGIATILCAIISSILFPFIEVLGIVLGVIIGVLLTTLMTFFIPPLSEKMNSEESTSLVGGTVDLDG